MDAADAAGSHEVDVCRRTDGERAADRGRPEHAGRDADGQVAGAGFARRVAGRCEALELARVEADLHPPVEHAHRSRHGARFADPPLRFEGDVETLDPGKAVRDERRFEPDDRAPGVERVAHLRRHLDHGVAPRCETHRAAVSSASSTPPTR